MSHALAQKPAAKDAQAKNHSSKHSASPKVTPAFTSVPSPVIQRCACGGGCPSCQAEKEENEALPIQAKLRIGAPNDKYEQEADRVAEQVMRMPEPSLQRQMGEEEEEGFLQTKPLLQRRATDNSSGSEVSPMVHEVLRSPGQPLDSNTRLFMESRFGHDFSQVRVHTNARAAESARKVNARAYTVGRNLVFENGQYAPTTSKGKKLLAHELTHVIQQQSNCRSKLTGLKRVQRTVEDIREDLDRFRSSMGFGSQTDLLLDTQLAWRLSFGITRRLEDESEGQAVLDMVRQIYGGAISLQFLQWLDERQIIDSDLSQKLEIYLMRYRDVQSEWFRQHPWEPPRVEMPLPPEVYTEPTVYVHDIQFLEGLVNGRRTPLGRTILRIGGTEAIETYNRARDSNNLESLKNALFPFPRIYPANILTQGRCRISSVGSILMQNEVHLPVHPPWSTRATPQTIRSMGERDIDLINAMQPCLEGQAIPLRIKGTPDDGAFEELIRQQENEHVSHDQRTVEGFFNNYRDAIASLIPTDDEDCEEQISTRIRQIRDSYFSGFFEEIDRRRIFLDELDGSNRAQPSQPILTWDDPGPGSRSNMAFHSHAVTFVRGNCDGVIFTWRSHPVYSSD